jgi:tetratricopeptide (TPR) repeat protein
MKQGKIQEAIKAYTRAVELKPSSAQLSSLYRKLAKAYLSLDESSTGDDRYKEVIAQALKWLHRYQEELAAKGGKTPAAAKSALPQQIILSATKKLLDAVGSGQISFDEFRRSGIIEYVNVPKLDPGKDVPPR